MARGLLQSCFLDGPIASRPTVYPADTGVCFYWASDEEKLYVANKLLNGNANWNQVGFSGGSTAWGSITGTLSAQTDLQTALNAKLSSINWGGIGGTLGNQTDLQTALDGKASHAARTSYSPALAFGGASTGITYGTGGQAGWFEEFGGMCFFSGHITLSSKGTATGNATISLPATAATLSQLLNPIHMIWSALATNWVNVRGTLSSGVSVMNVGGAQAAAANNFSGLTNSDFSDTSIIAFSGCYPI